MVKGVYKQVVVINSHHKGDFEQAIFILPQKEPEGAVKSPEEFVSLANDLASHRAIKGKRRFNFKKTAYALAFFALGALLASAVWWWVLSVAPLAAG